MNTGKTRLSRRMLLAGAAGAALWPLPSAGQAAALLSQGGCTIYFRHGATNRSGEDGPRMPREEQRLLSEAGVAQSERIGARFRALRLPVGPVLVSPMWRCRDMGQIAFGQGEVEERLLNASNPGRPYGRRAWLRGMLATAVPRGRNTVLIGHAPNILSAAGLGLAEGEAGVFRGDGANFELLARFMPEDW